MIDFANERSRTLEDIFSGTNALPYISKYKIFFGHLIQKDTKILTRRFVLKLLRQDSQVIRFAASKKQYSYYVIFDGSISTFSNIYSSCVIDKDHHLT